MHDLFIVAGHASYSRSDLYDTDPAPHARTAGEDLDDLDDADGLALVQQYRGALAL